jgi:hypothetical protein
MLFIVSLLIFAHVGQALAASPQFLSVTETFHSPGERGMVGLDTFAISIQGKQWVLDVKKAQDLQGNELGLEILQNVFPTALCFMGPKNLLASLEKPEAPGRLLSIQGYINVLYNRPQVTAVGTGSGRLQMGVYNEIRTICPAR